MILSAKAYYSVEQFIFNSLMYRFLINYKSYAVEFFSMSSKCSCCSGSNWVQVMPGIEHTKDEGGARQARAVHVSL